MHIAHDNKKPSKNGLQNDTGTNYEPWALYSMAYNENEKMTSLFYYRY